MWRSTAIPLIAPARRVAEQALRPRIHGAAFFGLPTRPGDARCLPDDSPAGLMVLDCV